MKTSSSRIWIRVAVSISYDDNFYTTALRRGDTIANGNFSETWLLLVDNFFTTIVYIYIYIYAMGRFSCKLRKN